MKLFLSTKNKLLLTSLCVFIIAFIIGYKFVYRVNIKKANRIRNKIEEIKNINLTLNEIKKMQDEIIGYLSMQADSSDSSSFLAKISEIADTCDVKIDSIDSGKPMTDGGHTFLPCKMTFRAPYTRLGLFISKLEGDKKFIRIDSLSLTPIKTPTTRTISSKGKKGDARSMEVNGYVPKKDEQGVWVNVQMEVVGFYSG